MKEARYAMLCREAGGRAERYGGGVEWLLSGVQLGRGPRLGRGRPRPAWMAGRGRLKGRARGAAGDARAAHALR